MSCWFVCQLVGQPVKNMRIMRNWSPNEWEDKSTLVMRISDTNSEAGVHNYRTFQVLCHQWKRTFLENLMLQLNTSLHLKMWVISCPTKKWLRCTICFVSIGGALTNEIHSIALTIIQLNRPIVKNLFLSFRTEIFPQIFTYAAYISQSNNVKALFSHRHSFVSNVLLHKINLRTRTGLSQGLGLGLVSFCM